MGRLFLGQDCLSGTGFVPSRRQSEALPDKVLLVLFFQEKDISLV